MEAIPNGVSVEEFNVSNEEIDRVKKKYRLEADNIAVIFAGSLFSLRYSRIASGLGSY